MNFLAILAALVIEQARPLAQNNFVYAAIRGWVRLSSRNLDTGQTSHAALAWAVAVIAPGLLVWAVHGLLGWSLGAPAVLLWHILVLYLCLGFRQFSHYFTGLRDALEHNDEDLARQRLAQWQQVEIGELPRSQLLRYVIEYSVLAAHRHVFGVLCCYTLLAILGLGPAGAVIYRLGEFVARYWVYKDRSGAQPVSPALQTMAARVWYRLDWLPVRATALGFAVVGNFEEAIDQWRRYVQLETRNEAENNDGLLIAATAGAINLRLGGQRLRSAASNIETSDQANNAEQPCAQPAAQQAAPASVSGREPQWVHLSIVVGLVWRCVVLWMLLLALLSLARALG